MSTTVHIPPRLLARVDARARARGISRNRLIVEALEGSLGARTSWPPELVSMLGEPIDAKAASELAASLKRTPRRWTADIRDWSPNGHVHLNRRHPDLGSKEALH